MRCKRWWVLAFKERQPLCEYLTGSSYIVKGAIRHRCEIKKHENIADKRIDQNQTIHAKHHINQNRIRAVLFIQFENHFNVMDIILQSNWIKFVKT